jgi:CRP-like cAMP-binding protein
MFIGGLLDRNIRIEADLTDQLCNSSERRLARLLLLLANFGKKNGKPKSIVANISQETLAAMVGTTRSRVSYFMNKFRKQGLIDYNGTIKVHGLLMKSALDDQLNI